MLEMLHWLGHDTFRIDGPPVVYLDPYKLGTGLPPADLILITHDHFDHLSEEDLEKVRTPVTVVAGPPEVAAKLGAVEVLRAGESRILAEVPVTAVPAYNTNKQFHPKGSGKVGFVFTVAGVKFYHAGDTDLIPEMDGLRPDVALLPVSGTYVMTASEAAEAARRIAPRIVVPMHYGTIVGSDADAHELVRCLQGSGIEVVVKPKE
ncbi:MAG: MBL fold metallo-hydrolase [Thermoanaerobaculaceae bacterium]|nr:MBL fold metallo-hydrolase [Thermoanaerobaculaceae bacterium]MDI9622392.1 MBL fold metallo-hydrolase [Acidobacteriota bacterium]NLH11147.1 MBL fold metallo-hydrolase [Holophagae bacterium]HPW54293.1 MBL fold metallo-hydrolase [Thermoanaerobaculaceae bacterium]